MSVINRSFKVGDHCVVDSADELNAKFNSRSCIVYEVRDDGIVGIKFDDDQSCVFAYIGNGLDLCPIKKLPELFGEKGPRMKCIIRQNPEGKIFSVDFNVGGERSFRINDGVIQAYFEVSGKEPPTLTLNIKCNAEFITEE